MVAKLTVDDAEVKKLFKHVEETLGGDVRPIWREFAQFMRAQVDKAFKKGRHGGAIGRGGISWSYFRPQYTRSSDGVTVPAWGGVPKVAAGYSAYKVKGGKTKSGKSRKTGGKNVRGRMRPSGARVKSGDSIMQDTGTMRARAALVQALKKNTLSLGPQGVTYAAAQNEARPFLFFEPNDAKALIKIAVKRLQAGTL